MKVVLDTNVLVSAALKRNSTPASAVRLVEQHDLLLKSRDTERQLLAVIARPYFVSLIGGDSRACAAPRDVAKSAPRAVGQSAPPPLARSTSPRLHDSASVSQRFTHWRPGSVPVSGRGGLAMAQAVTNATSSNAVVR